MTVIRTLATHEVVRLEHPRPVTERDAIGMAVGKAIDSAVATFSHEFRERRRPTAASMMRLAESVLSEQLEDAALELPSRERAEHLGRIAGVLQAFRKSALFGLSRPRSRIVLINGSTGIYAQPDFWDGGRHFYEMKSYRAIPTPPDVALQLELFQLAFPASVGVLASFDRHATPTVVILSEVPPLAPEESLRVLRLAHRAALEHGIEKVLEYVDNPVVRYEVAPVRAD